MYEWNGQSSLAKDRSVIVGGADKRRLGLGLGSVEYCTFVAAMMLDIQVPSRQTPYSRITVFERRLRR